MPICAFKTRLRCPFLSNSCTYARNLFVAKVMAYIREKSAIDWPIWLPDVSRVYSSFFRSEGAMHLICAKRLAGRTCKVKTKEENGGLRTIFFPALHEVRKRYRKLFTVVHCGSSRSAITKGGKFLRQRTTFAKNGQSCIVLCFPFYVVGEFVSPTFSAVSAS